ncbi:MAG: cytochrome [Chthoniobacteraceae bacterium]|nr:cytochrome [Chthoniobacteraceae bacterium]
MAAISTTLPLPPVVRNPRHWFFGPAYYAQREPLKWIPKWFEQYGDLFTVSSPLGRATILGRPEWARQVLADAYPRYQQKSQAYVVLRLLMGNGLVTSSGEFWRGQRRLAQPAFHRRRLDFIFGMMVEQTLRYAKRFEQQAGGGRTLDVAPLLSHLTLDIISRAMFSTDVNAGAAEVSEHIAALNEYALRLLRQPWLFLLPRRIPTPLNYREITAGRKLEKIVMSIISERRRNADMHDDLLAMLLSACDEETGRGMSDVQLRDEVMTIFVAGHETTANAMSWLMFLVSQHPEIEEKLTAEIDAAWASDSLGSGSISNFPYTRQVVEESLRLYPTIWSVGRQCGEEDAIGGFKIPVGMNVVVPIFHFHRSERYWNDPMRFDPERFSPERRPAAEPMIYFPFGAGPRNCIGNHFALQEMVIMTAVFYRYFTFRLEPGFLVEPDPLITLRPKHGVRLQIVSRRKLEGGT